MAATFSMFRVVTLNLLKKSNIYPSSTTLKLGGTRNLMSYEILGLNNFDRQKSVIQEKVGDLRDKFRERMEEYMDTSRKNTIFTDDLKTMVYAADSENEIETTVKMLKRFHGQQSAVRFSTFVFGPLVMRMLHRNKSAKLALQLFKDESLSGFFDQMSSYVILQDLLFETGHYQEVLDVMEIITDRALNGVKYPTDPVTITMAACLKLNTVESYQSMENLLMLCKEAGSNLSLKSIVFASALALKQDKSEVAFEILGLTRQPVTGRTPIVVANMKVLCLVKLGRLQQAIEQVREVTVDRTVAPDSMHTIRTTTIFPDVIEELQGTVSGSEDKAAQVSLELLNKSLEQGNYIADSHFEHYLFAPIFRPKQLQDGYRSRPRSAIGGMTRERGRREFHKANLNTSEDKISI